MSKRWRSRGDYLSVKRVVEAEFAEISRCDRLRRRGRIQVLVSMSGKRCKGSLAGYTASKFALMGLCQTMRNEGWDQNIRVTAVCPGWVNTQMAAGVKTMPPEQMTQPEDLASLCAHLLTLPSAAVPFECAVNASLER